MTVDMAEANVNRTSALAGTSIAIFTFLLFFLYPRYYAGTIDSTLFQFSLTVIGFAIFCFVFAGLYYYALTLPQAPITKQASYRRRADSFWLIGFSLLLLEPSLILFTVGLNAVAIIWLLLWIAYFGFTLYEFKQTQAWIRKSN